MIYDKIFDIMLIVCIITNYDVPDQKLLHLSDVQICGCADMQMIL
jgi:hypothetical protein